MALEPMRSGHAAPCSQTSEPRVLDEYKAGQVQVSAQGGKVSTAMILGAYQSAREGQRVSLPLD